MRARRRGRRARALLAGVALALSGLCAGIAAARDTPAPAEPVQAVVTRVSDGDTLWLRVGEGKPFKLRLQGIDAPERCQAWGPEAREALAGRVLRRTVWLRTRAHDDYDRVLGDLHLLDGEDVSAWMVAQGHAWSYRYRRSAGRYAEQEQQARAARRGLFADAAAVEPAVFRRLHGPCERVQAAP